MTENYKWIFSVQDPNTQETFLVQSTKDLVTSLESLKLDKNCTLYILHKVNKLDFDSSLMYIFGDYIYDHRVTII